VKFLADSMLGKLARWLRMLGQDVTYDVKLDDDDLLELAKTEDRALLTRDLELFKRAAGRGIETCFVEGKTESDRLSEVANRFGLKLEIDMEKSHCPICNSKLQAAPKETLAGELEENTYKFYKQFWKCPNCGQIYWQGAHWKEISSTLNEAKAKMEKLKEEIEA